MSSRDNLSTTFYSEKLPILVFDIGETLIDFKKKGLWYNELKELVIPEMYKVISNLFKYKNLPFLSFEQFLNLSYKIITTKKSPEKFRTLEFRYSMIISDIINKISLNLNMDVGINNIHDNNSFWNIISKSEYSLLIDKWLSIFEKTLESAELYSPVPSVLYALKEHGYRLGFFSNTPWQCPGYMINKIMKKFNLLRFFEKGFYSGDIGLAKPDPKVLRFVADSFSVNIKDIVYIGNEEKDVLAANNAGCRSVRLLHQICSRADFINNSKNTFNYPKNNKIKEKNIKATWEINQIEDLIDLFVENNKY